MKKTIEYPYVVCIALLILAGILVNYLLITNRNLRREVEVYQREAERLELFYQQTTDLYFSGLQSCRVDVGKYDIADLQDVVIVCLPAVTGDSLESNAFKYTLTHLQNLKSQKVVAWIYGDQQGKVNDWIKAYGYDTISSVQKPLGLPDASVFYLGSGQKAEAFFKIQPYAVHLLDKYIKFLRDRFATDNR